MTSEHLFTPPPAVARNAKEGLALRETFGRGGTRVGVELAQALANRKHQTTEDITHMASYFARHAVDKDAKSHVWGNRDNPSAGFIAWQLWGGDEGREWVESVKKQLED